MAYVKRLNLHNFKKFVNNSFDFDEGINIIIGQNDSGKSTLLQALDICLNQHGNGDWKNKSEYGTLMNVVSRDKFLKKDNQSYKDLPMIRIEVIFEGLEKNFQASIFDGIINDKKESLIGVSFEYSFDEQFIPEFNEIVNKKFDFIPFEFYTAKWITFGGIPYNFRKNPMKSILIDTDKSVGDSYRNFTKQIFETIDRNNQRKISINLKKTIANFNQELESSFELSRNLKIDPNRIVVQDNLDVVSKNDEMLLRDMGSGTENMIKTELAMSAESDLILLEEPENHLSFDLAREQVYQLRENNDNRQIIVTTHSPLLVSKLNIQNVKWLNTEGKLISFNKITEETAKFFFRADNIDVLQVILASKIILVEGATEYILMENMVKQVTERSAISQRIHIISMSGNYYKRFQEIIKITKNKALIITDNDGNEQRKLDSEQYKNECVNVAMPSDTDKFTFESALFQENKDYFKDNWDKKANSTTWKKYKSLDERLVWMLKHKVDAALKYESDINDARTLKTPKYIEEGIKWLIK